MLPSQFKRLIETLRVHLGAIQEAVKKETDAAKDKKATEREEDQDTVGTLRSISDKLETGNQQHQASSEQEDRQQQQLINGQNRLVFWAALAFFAASGYGAVALWQGILMYRTYGEVQNQRTVNERLLTEAQNSLDTEQSHFDRGMKEALVQTAAAITSADAAKSAAVTANKALHVSERAYLRIGDPKVDIPGHEIILPIVNTGHIPSGKVDFYVFEATAVFDPSRGRQQVEPTEGHWTLMKISSVPSGDVYYSERVNAPQLTKDFVNKSLSVIIAGEYPYGDGFPDDPMETSQFCIQTHVDETKNITFRACNPGFYIPAIKHSIHYPNHEEKTDSEYYP